MKYNKLKLNKRMKNNLLRVTAFLLFAVMVVNTTVAIYAYTPQTYQYSMVNGELMLLDDDLEPLPDIIESPDQKEETTPEPTKETTSEPEDDTKADSEEVVGAAQIPGINPEAASAAATETPGNTEALEITQGGNADASASADNSPDASASVSPTAAASATPTAAASATPAATASATPSAAPVNKGVSKLTVDENGNIFGVNIEKLTVRLSYSNKEIIADDTFGLEIKSGDGEFYSLSASGVSVTGSGSSYAITGIGKETTSFTISGLDKKEFSMYAFADSDNEADLSFSYDAQVETEENDPSAVLIIKVTADKAVEDDELERKEFLEDSSIDNSASSISSVRVALMGEGIDSDVEFVVKDTSSNEDEFKSYIENSEYTLVENGLYVFDMQFEKDGEYVAVNQDVNVALNFDPALFEGNAFAQYYLVLHAGEEKPLARIDGSEQGLSEISFTTDSFSPFAIAAVSEEQEEDTDRAPKTFDMGALGWVTGSSVSKKVGTGYIPIGETSISLNDGDELKLTIQYRIDGNVTFVLGDIMTYEIPEYLTLVSTSGEVTGNDGEIAGHYQINAESRILTITLDEEDYISSKQGKFSGGMITFNGKLDTSKLEADENGEVTILYSVAKCQVNLGPEKEAIKDVFEIQKIHDVSKDKEDALAYTITVSAKEADPEQTYTNVQVEDKFISAGDNVAYDQEQFPDVTVEFDENEKSFVWMVGEMKSGDTKEITYYVKYDPDEFNNTSLINTATLTVEELSGELQSTVTVDGNSKVKLSKTVVAQNFESESGEEVTGNYNWIDHTVKYELKVSAPKSNAFAVNDVVVKDAFKDTNGSNEYVLNEYTFELEEGGNPEIENQTSEGFDWIVGTLQPGETKTLIYTVKLVDFSDLGETAYKDGKLDIWYRGDGQRNPTYTLENGATLWIDDEEEDEETATVKFSKVFVWKDTTHTKVNAEKKTVTFEIHANETSKGTQLEVPAFNMTGWQFHDQVTQGWIYTGELKVYAFDRFQEGAGNASPALTYSFDSSGINDNFSFSNATSESETSEFIFTVPDDESIKNKYLILVYDITLLDESKWGNISYDNSIGLGMGGGYSLKMPSSTAKGNAAFGGGIQKEFVARSGDLLNWESTVTADVKAGSTVRDWVANSSLQTFQESDLNLVIKQGGTILQAGSDYSYKIDNKGQFTVTFNKEFTGTITLNYNTKINKDYFKNMSDGDTNLWNYCELKVPYGKDAKGQDTYLTDTDSAVYSYPHYSDITKAIRENCLTKDGTLEWKITVNKSGGMSSAIVQEVAPDGTVIDLDSIKIGARGENAGNAQIVSKELTDDGKGAIIKLEGLQEALDTSAYVEIWVKTKVVDDDFWLGENASAGREFVNKARLLDENGNALKEVKASYSAKYSPISKSGTYDSQKGELSYTIVVNQYGNDLLQNEDSITLVDDMDSSISVIPESIVVTGKNGVIDTSGKINYKPAGVENGFAITIPDDQKVTITYKVQVNAAVGTRLSVSNSAYFYGKSVEVKPVEKKMEFYVQTCGVTVLSDQVAIRKTTSSGNPLEGAEFKIYVVESNGSRTLSQTVTTDAGGNAIINGLIAGKLYAYEETKAPAGYMFERGDIHYFWVSESDSTKAPKIPAGVSNVETYQFRATIYVINDKPGFAVIKTGEDGETLANAEFTLYQDDAEVAKAVTDSNGLAIFKELEAGSSYRLEETKAPDYYIRGESSFLINIDQAGKITVDEQSSSQTATYIMGETVESSAVSYPSVIIKNELKKGAVKLVKKDSEDGRLLEGAVFELYRVDDSSSNGEGSRYPSDTVTYTTDANGEILVTQLPVGTYYFKEIIPPEDYQLSENLESERVTLVKENVEDTADNPLTVEVTNKKLSGVVLQKVGSDGKELAGAEFELYKEDGTLIGSYVTGTNGVLHVAKRLDEGNYYFVEIKAPEGYLITLDANGEAVKYPFTVDAEHNSTVGIDLGKIENQSVPTPEPDPTPEDTPTQTQDDNPEPTPGGDGEPSPEIVPEGNDVEGQVLGASRVRASGLEAAVLGARRGTDFAVLGKRRRPSTGDSIEMIIWIIALGAAAGAAITAGTMLYVKKKDEK